MTDTAGSGLNGCEE